MNIAIIGASGYVGSALLKEALTRGHTVAAIVSNPAKIQASSNIHVMQADVNDTDALSRKIKGHDVVISAFSGHAHTDIYNYYLNGVNSIITAVKASDVPRLLLVGGAGSLEVAPGVQLVDTPVFPEQWKATAEGARDALNLLKQEQDLNWTMLSPSAYLEPGTRTANFRLGTDQLITDDEGNSCISLEDYAVAMLDEVENALHQRQRFTVGY